MDLSPHSHPHSHPHPHPHPHPHSHPHLHVKAHLNISPVKASVGPMGSSHVGSPVAGSGSSGTGSSSSSTSSSSSSGSGSSSLGEQHMMDVEVTSSAFSRANSGRFTNTASILVASYKPSPVSGFESVPPSSSSFPPFKEEDNLTDTHPLFPELGGDTEHASSSSSASSSSGGGAPRTPSRKRRRSGAKSATQVIEGGGGVGSGGGKTTQIVQVDPELGSIRRSRSSLGIVTMTSSPSGMLDAGQEERERTLDEDELGRISKAARARLSQASPVQLRRDPLLDSRTEVPGFRSLPAGDDAEIAGILDENPSHLFEPDLYAVYTRSRPASVVPTMGSSRRIMAPASFERGGMLRRHSSLGGAKLSSLLLPLEGAGSSSAPNSPLVGGRPMFEPTHSFIHSGRSSPFDHPLL